LLNFITLKKLKQINNFVTPSDPVVAEGFSLYGTQGIKWNDTECKGSFQSPIDVKEPMSYAENLELNTDNIINSLTPQKGLTLNKGALVLEAGLGYVVTRDPILFHKTSKDVFLRFDCSRLLFRSPAEHSLYSSYADIEMQMECVLQTDSEELKEYRNRILSISYFFYGDDQLDQQVDTVSLLQGFNFDTLLNVNVGYFRKIVKSSKFVMYEGSLSRPPCTENILHILDHKIYKVPKLMFDNLKNTLSDKALLKFGNARPVQDLNKRPLIRNFEKAEKPKLTTKPEDFN
jgi:hypothetical protein